MGECGEMLNDDDTLKSLHYPAHNTERIWWISSLLILLNSSWECLSTETPASTALSDRKLGHSIPFLSSVSFILFSGGSLPSCWRWKWIEHLTELMPEREERGERAGVLRERGERERYTTVPFHLQPPITPLHYAYTYTLSFSHINTQTNTHTHRRIVSCSPMCEHAWG